MLKSMTGFGLASTDYKQSKITVEAKSLNSKFLELSLKLPRAHMQQEMLIRTDSQKLADRGKLSVVVTIDQVDKTLVKSAKIDRAVFSAWYSELKSVAEDLGESTVGIFQLCLTLPDVIRHDEIEVADEEEWKAIYSTFLQAMKNMDAFRISEGKVLHDDIKSRILILLETLKRISSADTSRIPAIKTRIADQLEQLVSKTNYDQNRLEQELIYYVEKLDITEEKTRLKSHCDYFLQTLDLDDANGKKLGFIGQEIGREINTIGSKVNDAIIQRDVVLMKDELEKIKEQLLNIL